MKYENRLDCCTHTEDLFFQRLHHQQTQYSLLLMPFCFFFIQANQFEFMLLRTLIVNNKKLTETHRNKTPYQTSTTNAYMLPHLNMTHAHIHSIRLNCDKVNSSFIFQMNQSNECIVFIVKS